MTLKIAIAQIDIALGKPAINEQTVIEYAQKAASVEADILVYPEMWNTGYDLLNLETVADPQGQRSVNLLRDLAKNIISTLLVVLWQQPKQRTNFTTRCLFSMTKANKLVNTISYIYLD